MNLIQCDPCNKRIQTNQAVIKDIEGLARVMFNEHKEKM